MKLCPKNWTKFQHYKDRNPPWIKLHRDLLIDRKFMCLPLASKAIAPMLWLLASETQEGTFDGSTEELSFRLHLSPKDIETGLKPLIDNGFFVLASGMLAERKQVAIPETETERETETKKEIEPKPPVVTNRAIVIRPEVVSSSVWESFLQLRKAKKAPLTQAALSGIQREADKAGWTLEDALQKCCERGWQGFDASWVEHRSKGLPQDDALKKIKEDASLSAPMPDKVRSILAGVVKRM